MFDAFSTAQLAWAALVVFAAYIVRGMSGFGAGLIATPLLAFTFPITLVVPTTALLVFVLFIFLTLRDRHRVAWDEFWRLLAPTLVGVVCGLYLFSVLDNRLLTKLLGGFLIAYAIYMLISEWIGLQQLKLSTRWAWPLGLSGALIDAMFGGGGGTLPVIYMHGRQVARDVFRATLAALWFVEMVARIGGYALAGFYTQTTLTLVAAMLPFMALGTWAGEKFGNRLTAEAFNRLLAVLLLFSGVSLLLK